MSEIIRTGVSRMTRRSGRQWSKVEHLARVDHSYGGGHIKWVVPLCGVKPGRASFAETDKLCERCALRQAGVDATARAAEVTP